MIHVHNVCINCPIPMFSYHIPFQAKEIHQWKLEEARILEQARFKEEAALAIVEMEKAKCKVAIEAAEKAQKIAEMETQRRKYAELMVQQEAEEKKRALNVLTSTMMY